MTTIVSVTEVALKRLKAMAEKDSPKACGIRFGVKAGGCSGFEYILKTMAEEDIRDDDFVEYIKGLRMFINAKSIPYVQGTKIDFTLMGFTFDNPKAKSGCGCGLSFNA